MEKAPSDRGLLLLADLDESPLMEALNVVASCVDGIDRDRLASVVTSFDFEPSIISI
jgi:hypothetical protein